MADLDDIKDGKDFHLDTPQRNTPFNLKGCGALDWGCSPAYHVSLTRIAAIP